MQWCWISSIVENYSHIDTQIVLLMSAEARCKITGHRLNEISECWVCGLGLDGVDWLIPVTQTDTTAPAVFWKMRLGLCECACVCTSNMLCAQQVLNRISAFSCVCFPSERLVPHKLFTPLLIGMVATGVCLSLILVVLLYKYMQVLLLIHKEMQCHYFNTI